MLINYSSTSFKNSQLLTYLNVLGQDNNQVTKADKPLTIFVADQESWSKDNWEVSFLPKFGIRNREVKNFDMFSYTFAKLSGVCYTTSKECQAFISGLQEGNLTMSAATKDIFSLSYM